MNKVFAFICASLIVMIISFMFWLSFSGDEYNDSVSTIPVELSDQQANELIRAQHTSTETVISKTLSVVQETQEIKVDVESSEINVRSHLDENRVPNKRMKDSKYADLIAKLRARGNVNGFSDQSIIDLLENNPDLIDELSMSDEKLKILENYYDFDYLRYVRDFPIGFSGINRLPDEFDFLNESDGVIVPSYISTEEQRFIDEMRAKDGVTIKEAISNGLSLDDGYIITEVFSYGDAVKSVSFYFEESPFKTYHLDVNDIKDENLKACIKDKLILETKNITYLNCNELIGSLEGLEGAISIKSMRLQFKGNIDLSPILEYKHIKNLDFNLGKNLDVRQLGNLTTLKSLALSSINVKNSQAIKNLTALNSLALHNVDGFNFSDIEDLQNLKKLSVKGEYFNKMDLSQLAKLEELTIIGDMDFQSNLDVMNQLNQLKKLTIYNATITQLPKLNNITELKISDSKLYDVSNLIHFKSLRILRLSDNELSNIPNLDQLNKLEVIDVSNNFITDISFLTHTNSLKMVYVFNNGLTDLSPIYNLPNLILLHAQGNQITDITGIENLNQLQDVILIGNPIENCYPASKLTNLIGQHGCD